MTFFLYSVIIILAAVTIFELTGVYKISSRINKSEE